ncbi:MAG: hypothetical protein ABIP93_16860 [Gemmatimonadaceae bacterium]
MTLHDDRRDTHDPVVRYLAERGVSTGLRDTGLRGIVARWDALASRATRYDLTLDDWLNDLDLRDIIAGAMSVAPEPERQALRSLLERADGRFRRATVESARPLVAGADRAAQWWYLRHPAQPGRGMRDDLVAAGLLARA